MKNFRKVLALVLVVATLFSFTAMTSAVNIGEYEDWSKVSYAEAVDVLSAVGILNGYEDDTFKPTNTISREEMAKMIATMANAGDDVSTLYASACTFADVPAAKWSASYVAYCAKTGIVAGRSASTFDPTGKVTGLETAKMLLVVLGFSAEEQGYVGADWKVNVLRDAKVMGLTNNFAADYDIDAAITREEAAQMMLNALEAPCVVGVISDGLVTVTNALIVNWKTPSGLADLLKVTAYGKLKDAMDAGNWCLYGNVLISNDTLWTRLYNGLTKTTADHDCYGRPATSWTWTDSKGNVKELALTAAAPVWSSYNADKTAIDKKVTEYTKNGVYSLAAADTWVDGKNNQTVEGGKGVLVELYTVGKKLVLVEINTYFGEIAEVNTAKGTFAIERKNDSKLFKGIKNTYGFEKEDEGTKVLFWPCGDTDGMHAVQVAEGKVITLHGTRVKAGYFCDTNENEYEYAENLAAAKVLSADLAKEDVTIYTDNYGYVIYWTDKTLASNVSVLIDNTATKSGHTVVNGTDKYSTYTVKMVDFEDNAAAEAVELAVDAKYADKDELYGEIIKLDGNKLVTYKVGEDARIDVEKVGTQANIGSETWILSDSGKIVNEDGVEVLGHGANTATQYIVRVWNYDGTYTYNYFDGKNEVDNDYVLTNLEYLVDDYNNYLTYVYAEAKYAATANLAFVLSHYTDESYADLIGENYAPVEYQLYKAIVNGQEALVAYEGELVDGMPANDLAYGAYKAEYVLINALSHDDLPIYKVVGAAKIADASAFIIEGDTLVYTKDNEKVFEDMAADASIVVIEEFTTGTKKGTFVATIVEDYDDVADYLAPHGWTTQYAYVAKTAGKVSTIYLYVVEKADMA